MIPVKSPKEIEIMRRACEITAAARALAGDMVRPGVTTAQIDKAVHDFIVSQGARPTFLNYGGFPASACISVNDVVIHGIPGSRVLKEGDIVSVDVGAMWNGFTGDCAGTFPCGKISPEAQRLIDVTRRSFFEYQPRNSPLMRESTTVTFSDSQKASLVSRSAFRMTTSLAYWKE